MPHPTDMRRQLMAREYGQIRHDMWSDDDWRTLTRDAQHLYMMLLSDPRLDYCGVTGWHPGKLAHRAAETTGRDILIAGAELSNRHFLVIDEETEEVLIRSYLRHDPVMRHPKLPVTVAKDFGALASNKIRAVIVYELNRLKQEQPGLAAWEHPAVKTVLRQNAVSAKTMDTDLPYGAATYLGVGQALPQGVGLGVTQGVETAKRDHEPRGALQQELELQREQATKTEVFAASNDSSYPQTARTFQRRGDAS